MSYHGSKHLPLVSVIMNCLNCEKYVSEAVQSVYSQTYPNWEIVFWDNASTDDSSRLVQTYGNRLRYFRGDETVPLGAARNLALKEARGDFLAFLDCDDIWLPEKLERQLELFSNPEVAIVYSDTIFFDSSGRQARLYSFRKNYVGKCFDKLLTDYFLSMETVIIRRSALDKQIYWFDERFSAIEEADLFRRLSYDNELAMVNEPLAMWRIHPNSFTWKNHKLFRCETELMLKKYEELYPGFSNSFECEIKLLKSNLAFTEAKEVWFSGQGEEARKLLKSSPMIYKSWLLYLASFFPPDLGMKLIPLVGRRKSFFPQQ